MAEIEECCGWLGWAAMAGIDAHGRRIRGDDVARVAPMTTPDAGDAATRAGIATCLTGCTPGNRDAA